MYLQLNPNDCQLKNKENAAFTSTGRKFHYSEQVPYGSYAHEVIDHLALDKYTNCVQSKKLENNVGATFVGQVLSAMCNIRELGNYNLRIRSGLYNRLI